MKELLVTLPPSAFAPQHVHGGSVQAYVVKGDVRSQLDGGAIGTFTPGTTWFEPRGTIHDFLENASSTEPAEILATFVGGECEPLTTYF